eukprot:jgi/Mesvir1/25795/Mv06773-RA.1
MLGQKPTTHDKQIFNPEIYTSQKRQWNNQRRKQQQLRGQAEEPPKNVFEHFVVVGLPLSMNAGEVYQDAIAAAQKGHPSEDAHRAPSLPTYEPDMRFKYAPGKTRFLVTGVILFKYPPGKKLCADHVASFCFPFGVQPFAVERTPSMSKLNEVVYSQKYLDDDEMSYIFLLQSGESAPLYGVCMVVHEMLDYVPGVVRPGGETSKFGARPLSRHLVAAPRCYCFLTCYPFFDLHFEVLASVLAQERLIRITEVVSCLAAEASLATSSPRAASVTTMTSPKAMTSPNALTSPKAMTSPKAHPTSSTDSGKAGREGEGQGQLATPSGPERAQSLQEGPMNLNSASIGRDAEAHSPPRPASEPQPRRLSLGECSDMDKDEDEGEPVVLYRKEAEGSRGAATALPFREDGAGAEVVFCKEAMYSKEESGLRARYSKEGDHDLGGRYLEDAANGPEVAFRTDESGAEIMVCDDGRDVGEGYRTGEVGGEAMSAREDDEVTITDSDNGCNGHTTPGDDLSVRGNPPGDDESREGPAGEDDLAGFRDGQGSAGGLGGGYSGGGGYAGQCGYAGGGGDEHLELGQCSPLDSTVDNDTTIDEREHCCYDGDCEGGDCDDKAAPRVTLEELLKQASPVRKAGVGEGSSGAESGGMSGRQQGGVKQGGASGSLEPALEVVVRGTTLDPCSSPSQRDPPGGNRDGDPSGTPGCPDRPQPGNEHGHLHTGASRTNSQLPPLPPRPPSQHQHRPLDGSRLSQSQEGLYSGNRDADGAVPSSPGAEFATSESSHGREGGHHRGGAMGTMGPPPLVDHSHGTMMSTDASGARHGGGREAMAVRQGGGDGLGHRSTDGVGSSAGYADASIGGGAGTARLGTVTPHDAMSLSLDGLGDGAAVTDMSISEYSGGGGDGPQVAGALHWHRRTMSSTSTFMSDTSSCRDGDGDGDYDSMDLCGGDDKLNDSLRLVADYYHASTPAPGALLSLRPQPHMAELLYTRPRREDVTGSSTTGTLMHHKAASGALVASGASGTNCASPGGWGGAAEVPGSVGHVPYDSEYLKEEGAASLATSAVTSLCHSLSLDNILAYLQAVLLEKQIVVITPNLGILSGVVLSLLPLLRPFNWQSVLLPLLPEQLLTVLDAPVPFVVGVQYKTTEVRSRSTHMIRLNVYKNKITNLSGPDLPRRKHLVSELLPFYNALTRLEPNMTPSRRRRRPVYRASAEQAAAVQGLLGVMRRYLSELCAQIRMYTITDVQDSKEKVSLLLKDSFIDSFSSADRPFMKAFVETQMFNDYTDNLLSHHG